MESCIYAGWVRHRRFEPAAHAFRYRIFLIYLDLGELDDVFRGRLLWSTRRPAVARFRRADHMGNPDVPLEEAVRDRIRESGREPPRGPVRLLTHLRYFGYVFNPVSFYFCHDEDGRLEVVVAEVNNTPWGERHCYVLDSDQFGRGRDERLAKEFHVSPFMPMDSQYRWRITPPAADLDLHLENFRLDRKMFDVTMHLRRQPIATRKLIGVLARYPLMTQRVLVAIYWQALRLWMKGCRFYPHPKKSAAADDRVADGVSCSK